MAVPSNITDLSVTASSNSPAGTDAVGTSLDDFLRVIQAMLKESGQTLYTATGTDTITFTTTPTFSAYQTGQRFWVKSAGANTGAVTLNINSLGAKNVYKDGSSALVAGDIPAANAVFQVVYDGTQFQCLSCHNINGATTISANSASAALTITQTGAGNALVVEDSASPDSTPFVVDTSGRVILGYTASGGVGVGSVQLSQHGTDFTTSSSIHARWSVDADSGYCIFAKSRGATPQTYSIVNNADALGRLQFRGADGTGLIEAAQISAFVDGTPGTNDMPGRLVFSTTADGASSSTERMRIASDGTTTLGGTSTAPALSVIPVASQTRWVTVTGSNGGNPTISASGGSLNLNRGLIQPVVTNTAGTLTIDDTHYQIIQTTAASVYTLPTASNYTGRVLKIVTQFAGTVTSNASNVVPISGGAAGTAILAATAGKFATLVSNGTNWVITEAN